MGAWTNYSISVPSTFLLCESSRFNSTVSLVLLAPEDILYYLESFPQEEENHHYYQQQQQPQKIK